MTAVDPRKVAEPAPAATLLDDPSLDQPRRLRKWTIADMTDTAAAFLVAAAVSGLLRQVLGWGGILGTAIWFVIVFLAAFFVLARNSASEEGAVDRLATVAVWSAALFVIGALGWMLVYLIKRGLPGLKLSFFTHDMRGVGPLNPGGGVKHAIIGSLEQVGIAAVVVVPLAILTAVYLNEIGGRLAWPTRFIVDALVGLPSIVAGLLVYSVWVVHFRFSGIAGSMAIAIIMLPLVTRTAEENLRTVSDTLREASLALGSPRWKMIMRVVLPTARAGLLTAVILGVATAFGETAPVLLTAEGSNFTNVNPLHGPQADLPLYIYQLIFQPNKVDIQRGWTALLVLVILVLFLFISARLIAGRSERRLRGRR
jgi:phosphate transport system permease protein